MDSNELALWTIYDSKGVRIGLGVQVNIDEAKAHGAEMAKLMKSDSTYKVWIAKEVGGQSEDEREEKKE